MAVPHTRTRRVGPAAALIGLALLTLAALLIGEVALLVLLTILLLGAYVELRRMLSDGGSALSLALGAGAVGGLAWLGAKGRVEDLPWVLALLTLAVLGARVLLVELGGADIEGAVTDLGATVAAAAVAGLGGAHVLLVRAVPEFGFRGVLFLVVLLAANGLAHGAGTAVARRRLPPGEEPGPLGWEAMAVGVAASTAAGAIAGAVLDPPFSASAGALFGAGAAVLIPAGDLAGEAILAGTRRAASGILDATAGLLLASVAFYWAFRTLVL